MRITLFGLAVVAGLMLGGCARRGGGDGIDGLAMANIVRLTYSNPTTPQMHPASPTNPPHN
jgi:hypothetical protein